jgi:hypothetical protein
MQGYRSRSMQAYVGSPKDPNSPRKIAKIPGNIPFFVFGSENMD